MKFFRSSLPARAAVAASMLIPLFVAAHPGHDHSDIPAVVRHPFAGVEHLAVVATLVVAMAGAAMFAVKVWRASSRHGAHSRTTLIR